MTNWDQKKKKSLDCPGGPVVKILSSQCPEWEFEHPWSGKSLYATWPKNFKIILKMFKSLVLHLRWLRNPGLPQASVTPPLQALSPLLALGQDVSAVPSSPTLMTRPPVLPGGPVHSQVMWPYSLFSGHPHL